MNKIYFKGINKNTRSFVKLLNKKILYENNKKLVKKEKLLKPFPFLKKCKYYLHFN